MPTPSGRARDVVSAGAVVLGPDRTVLLVHRPKYDDWSFPKGKLDRGEHPTVAAVREVEEETGLRIRLGVPLGDQHYPIRAGTKLVHYWVGRAVDDGDVSRYQPNAEIDEVAWYPVDKARDRLSYEFDVATLDEALGRAKKTQTLVVLRHGRARAKKTWRDDDRRRPLLATGKHQAAKLVPVLAAYHVRRLVSSSSTRCLQTLEPYAERYGVELERQDALSEEDATRRGVRRAVERLVEELKQSPPEGGGLVVCSHGPVLPCVFAAIGLDDLELEKGEMAVLQLRKDKVRSYERHFLA